MLGTGSTRLKIYRAPRFRLHPGDVDRQDIPGIGLHHRPVMSDKWVDNLMVFLTDEGVLALFDLPQRSNHGSGDSHVC